MDSGPRVGKGRAGQEEEGSVTCGIDVLLAGSIST